MVSYLEVRTARLKNEKQATSDGQMPEAAAIMGGAALWLDAKKEH